MLATSVEPSTYSLRVRRKTERGRLLEEGVDPMADDSYDEDEPESRSGKARSKSRRELPAGAVATLKAWLLSPEHFTHPYPTPQDQAMLMQKTGIDKKQLKNWFTNARRRIWKPMLKKQIEQGKLAAPGTGVPGLMIPTLPAAAPINGTMDNPHSVQAIRVHYQQAMQQQAQQQQAQSAAQQPQGPASVSDTFSASTGTAFAPAPATPQFFLAEATSSTAATSSATPPANPQPTSSSSLGTLPQISSTTQLSKTDSHAVLMELFARDQDLVKQATESARLKAESKQQQQLASTTSQQSTANETESQQQQHPMKTPSQGNLPNVPTLNSWPHFSSITSLNNLGTIPGVKSITSLNGADLASKGAVNKMGNLAQVKSMESMGRNDSYAFLEVFFGDKSATNLSAMEKGDGKQQGLKMSSGGDEDNEIGLSLEDESPSQVQMKKEVSTTNVAVAAIPTTSFSMTTAASSLETSVDSGTTLKRAYDDALAARGLISVSRSSEKLTELPAKMQRTLSQDFISKQQLVHPAQQFSRPDLETKKIKTEPEQPASSQYPGEEPVEPGSEEDAHVQVSATTKCALCCQTNVDTQLRPCGHFFHERCLKPSLQTPVGPPVCPVDNIPMQSALLAVPTDECQPASSSSSSCGQTTSTPTTIRKSVDGA